MAILLCVQDHQKTNHEVSEIRIAHGYNLEGVRDDVALVRLKNAVSFGLLPNGAVACLPPMSSRYYMAYLKCLWQRQLW